jgi:hypothetical protein
MLLSLTLASAIAAAAALTPAQAMTAGTASGIKAALADAGLVAEVAYVCRHRFYTTRRICWWRPGPYRGWRWRRWRRW